MSVGLATWVRGTPSGHVRCEDVLVAEEDA